MEQLARTLIEIGAPLVGGMIGGPAGALATTALKELAKALNVPAEPAAIEKAIRESPSEAAQAVREAEDRMFGLWESEQRSLAELTKVSGQWTMFKDGWRPALCWALAFLWIWGLFGAPLVVSAGVKLAPVPVDHLVTFSTVLLTILGGGHTIKAVFGKS